MSQQIDQSIPNSINISYFFLKDQATNNETRESVKRIVNQYFDQFLETKQIIFLKDQAKRNKKANQVNSQSENQSIN